MHEVRRYGILLRGLPVVFPVACAPAVAAPVQSAVRVLHGGGVCPLDDCRSGARDAGVSRVSQEAPDPSDFCLDQANGEQKQTYPCRSSGKGGTMSTDKATDFVPDVIYFPLKRTCWDLIRWWYRVCWLRCGKRVDIGKRFRFSRRAPYVCRIGSHTCVEENNVWNAKNGDIVVGANCWIGLNNVVMGPIEIGDATRTGPHVSMLGPRRAVTDYDGADKGKTVIGKQVWISTGSIIHFGVTIGDRAIIAPGSVITRDVAPGAYLAGNPARDLTRVAPLEWKERTPDWRAEPVT
ncbi:MAG: hypothetical protein GF331_10900 [Chitinivibrionales bacterium]|nr:hypothetical protein [Chitinivibrionales bacterium]